MRSPQLLIALIFSLTLTGAGAQRPVTVPFEVLRTGHAAVKVTINGKGPFRLALDTGSPVTFVSNSCAARVGLLTKEEAEQQAVFQMPRAVHSIEIGAAKIKDLSVNIIDRPTVKMIV